MTIKPYTIIEILRSKGFNAEEAEELVEFITESSQEKILDAIKPLATREEVKDLMAEAKESIISRLENRIDERCKETETRLEDKIKETETRLEDKIKGSETRLEDKFKGSETRLDDKFKGSETRLDDKFKGSETRLEDKFKESNALTESKIKVSAAATELRIIKWLIGVSIATTGIIIATLKFLI